MASVVRSGFPGHSFPLAGEACLRRLRRSRPWDAGQSHRSQDGVARSPCAQCARDRLLRRWHGGSGGVIPAMRPTGAPCGYGYPLLPERAMRSGLWSRSPCRRRAVRSDGFRLFPPRHLTFRPLRVTQGPRDSHRDIKHGRPVSAIGAGRLCLYGAQTSTTLEPSVIDTCRH